MLNLARISEHKLIPAFTLFRALKIYILEEINAGVL